MKKALYILLLLSLMIPGVARAQENPVRLTYANAAVSRSQDGKTLLLSFTVAPGDKGVGYQEVVYIYPVLTAADGRRSITFDPVRVSGYGRYKVLRRAKALHSTVAVPDAAVTLRTKEIKNTPYTVSQSVPFESWMATATLDVKEAVYGCAECGKAEGLTNLLKAYIPYFNPSDYAYAYVEPKATAEKRYEEEFTSHINFVVDRHELKRDFADNAAELKRLDEFVQKSLSTVGATLDRVDIKGYASPEAPYDHNKALSERRANTLATYVKNTHPGLARAASGVHVEGYGEDWEGLRAAVEAADFDRKNQVLDAIDNYTKDTDREKAIYNIDNRVTYKYLLDNLYPPLRRTTFHMAYVVRAFAVEELPDIYKTNPMLMSHQELYLLAKQYEKQGKNPLPIYEYAYERFAADPLAALNLANARLQYAQDAAGAISLLAPMQNSDPRALFPLAIATDMQGDAEGAEAILRQAAESGNTQAAQILGLQ